MGRIIAKPEMPIAEIFSFEQAVADALLERAVTNLGLPKEQIILRDGLPATDFGLTNEVWVTPSLSANTWSDFITKTLPDYKVVAFYGVAVLSGDPIATGIRFQLGNVKMIDVIQFEDIFEAGESVGYFKEPVLYLKNQDINIDLYAKAAGTENLALKCLVAEQAGKTTL